MKTLLKKPASLLAILTMVLAMTFISSCSDDSSDPTEDPSSSSTPGGGDENSSSSGTGTSSSSGTEVVEYCVSDEGEMCISLTNVECTLLAAETEVSFGTTCPVGYEKSPKACFLYGEYCSTGYSADECEDSEGIFMDFNTCLRNVGAFTIGSCISGYYMEECNTNISQYYCEYMEGGRFVNGACPTTGSCEYEWGFYETRCVDGVTPSQCENDHEGYFSFNACPIVYCAYVDEDEELACEEIGKYLDSPQDAYECEDDYDGYVTTDDSSCDYKFSPIMNSPVMKKKIKK